MNDFLMCCRCCCQHCFSSVFPRCQVSGFHRCLLVSSPIPSWTYMLFKPLSLSVVLPSSRCTSNCCRCARGHNRLALQWICRTVSLSPPLQGRLQIENGALSIAVVNLSDSGVYQCVAENKHAIIYSSAQLMVLGKIASLPVLLSVCAFDHLLR